MIPSMEKGRLGGIPFTALFVGVVLGTLLWNTTLRGRLLLQHRTELGGVEHNVIHGIQKVMLGQTLYEDPERPPFDVIQYTPGYYVLCASIGKVIGLEGDDARSIFLLSRTVSLLLWVLTGTLVHAACRVGGAAQWSSVLAAGFSMCTTWEQSFSRMDALVLALAAATVVTYLRWSVYDRSRDLVWTALLGVAAILSKQSGVVIAAAPALHLLVSGQWKALRIMIPVQLAALGIGLGTTLFLGTPEAFYQNTVLGLRNGFSWMMYADLFAPATYKYFIGWHVMAALVVIHGWRTDHAPVRFLAVAIPLSLGFAMITGLKYGSRLNYLHESLMLTFIGVAILLPRMVEGPLRNGLAWSFALYGCVFAAFRTNSVAAWYRVGEPDQIHLEHLRADQVVREVLVKDLGLRPEEKVFITYREYLEHFLVGQSLMTQKDIVQYSRDRLFDHTAFHRAMRDGTVRYVITDGPSGPVTYLDSTYTDWVPIRHMIGRTILGRKRNP